MASTSTPPDIKASAEQFITSYAHAMSRAQPPSSQSTPATPVPTIAAGLSSHYLPNFTSFTLGSVFTMPDAAAAHASIQSHLERLVSSGVGCDVRLRRSRVEVVSGTSALCWVTWGMFPAEGWKGRVGEDGVAWEWENVYFYRWLGEGKEGWEGCIADEEISGIMKNLGLEYFGDYLTGSGELSVK
jgi:hypothetical protein